MDINFYSPNIKKYVKSNWKEHNLKYCQLFPVSGIKLLVSHGPLNTPMAKATSRFFICGNHQMPISHWSLIMCCHQFKRNLFTLICATPLKMLHISIVVSFYTLRLRQHGRHFADDTFKCIFLNENVIIAIKISLKFVPKGPINNIAALFQIMAWRQTGDKPLSEAMMASLLTHICVTRPQWVKVIVIVCNYHYHYSVMELYTTAVNIGLALIWWFISWWKYRENTGNIAHILIKLHSICDDKNDDHSIQANWLYRHHMQWEFMVLFKQKTKYKAGIYKSHLTVLLPPIKT